MRIRFYFTVFKQKQIKYSILFKVTTAAIGYKQLIQVIKKVELMRDSHPNLHSTLSKKVISMISHDTYQTVGNIQFGIKVASGELER